MPLIINYLSAILFFGIAGVGLIIAGPIFYQNEFLGIVVYGIILLIASLVSSAIKIAAQWERAVVLRLGKFKGVAGPGVFFIIPFIDEIRLVDTRILTMDIPKQQVITKDNVPVSINGVTYFKVNNPESAVIEVQNYSYAMSQYAQTALRDVIGGMSFDGILAERERIGKEISEIVDKQAKEWGLEVTEIRLMDVEVPEDLKRMMSRQASAEREKRATITKAEGDKMAALNLSEAAKTMLTSPGAMQLRTLQTIDSLGPSTSNTVVLAVPIEIMELINKYNHKADNGSLQSAK